MLKIESGTARDLGIKFWEIVNSSGVRLTEFNHVRFPTILDGASVYFIDLDLDPKLCENVQSAFDVDGFVQVAASAGGIDGDAEAALRVYIMAALLTALGKQGTARRKYLDQLHTKMATVAAAAPPPNHRVTLQLLISMGIAS